VGGREWNSFGELSASWDILMIKNQTARRKLTNKLLLTSRLWSFLREKALGRQPVVSGGYASEKPQFDSLERGLRAVTHREFGEDVRNVVFHSSFGETEFAGDFAVAGTVGN
jgi:hypothetical protein